MGHWARRRVDNTTCCTSCASGVTLAPVEGTHGLSSLPNKKDFATRTLAYSGGALARLIIGPHGLFHDLSRWPLCSTSCIYLLQLYLVSR